MKSLTEKRDELAQKAFCVCCLHYDEAFKAGWDACAKEYEKKNEELKRQLEVAKIALDRLRNDYSFGNAQVYIDIDKALNELSGKTGELESAGE